MLLPSALPCDYRAPPQSTINPVRRSSRRAQQTVPSSYRSPPLDESPSFLSSAPAGLFQTCRRLQQALSVDRLSTPPPVTPKKNITQKRRHQPVATPIGLAAAPPSTPRRLPTMMSIVGKNKRVRAAAFPGLPSENVCEMEGVESENSDRELRNPFSTPRNKRARLTTPPSPPNRNLRVQREDQEDEGVEWSLDEDKQLVDMVLGKLNLSKNDWEECARSFGGKDAESLGRRWEGLISSRKVGLKDKRKRRN